MMVKTIYIENDTLKALGKDLKERGLKVSETSFEPAELRIEFVNAAAAVILDKKWNDLVYTMASRTFPAGLVKDRAFSVPRRAMAKALKKTPQEIQEGKTGIKELDALEQGIRSLFIACEAIRLWMKDRPVPNPDDGILLAAGDPPELRVASGDERPALTFLKINTETGKAENESFRYYGDCDVKSVSDLCGDEGDIVSISKTTVDPETGEKKSVPVFGEEARSTRLMAELLREGGRIREGYSGGVNIREGLEKETLGRQIEARAPIRLFASVGDVRKLPAVSFPPAKLPEEIRQDFILELTDVAFTSVINADRERRNTMLTLYRRVALAMFSTAVARLQHQRFNDRDYLEDGTVEITGTDMFALPSLAVLKIYKNLLGILLAADCLKAIRQTPDSGIWITVEGENAVIKRVTGAQLPKVAAYVGNDFGMTSPHTGEEAEASSETLAELTPDMIAEAEKKLNGKANQDYSTSTDIAWLNAEAENGSAAALRRLGKLYEAGEIVPQDNLKAMEYYKKALAISPDDKDLEFDIFMLEMIM